MELPRIVLSVTFLPSSIPITYLSMLSCSNTSFAISGKEIEMSPKQGDVALLNDPVAQELLKSNIPARFSYTWSDGTPRVVPIWFHWNGEEIVVSSPPNAPKLKVLPQNPHVALTIDTTDFPMKVLLVRGRAQVEMVEGVNPEYAAAAERYFGPEQGRAWVDQVRGMFTHMARITVKPEWVGILDFEARFPIAIAEAMSG
jgi:hypothetical protein